MEIINQIFGSILNTLKFNQQLQLQGTALAIQQQAGLNQYDLTLDQLAILHTQQAVQVEKQKTAQKYLLVAIALVVVLTIVAIILD